MAPQIARRLVALILNLQIDFSIMLRQKIVIEPTYHQRLAYLRQEVATRVPHLIGV